MKYKNFRTYRKKDLRLEPKFANEYNENNLPAHKIIVHVKVRIQDLDTQVLRQSPNK